MVVDVSGDLRHPQVGTGVERPPGPGTRSGVGVVVKVRPRSLRPFFDPDRKEGVNKNLGFYK